MDTQTISYTYTTTGTYMVKLTVHDDENNTDTIHGDITVVDYPLAILDITDENGTSLAPNYIVEPGQTIIFDASGSTGAINSYYFGYDLAQAFIPHKTSEKPTYSYSYETEGNYSVGLRVVDDLGNKSQTEKEDFINITVRYKEDEKDGNEGAKPSDESSDEPYMYMGMMIILVILVTILFTLSTRSKQGP